MTVLLQFCWSFPQFNPMQPSIVREMNLDLGHIDEGDKQFTPELYFRPHLFNPDVAANESVRYHLEVEAENFRSKQCYVIEITWNGQWSQDESKMGQNVLIRDVTGDMQG